MNCNRGWQMKFSIYKTKCDVSITPRFMQDYDILKNMTLINGFIKIDFGKYFSENFNRNTFLRNKYLVSINIV